MFTFISNHRTVIKHNWGYFLNIRAKTHVVDISHSLRFELFIALSSIQTIDFWMWCNTVQ